jgi:hypothetical protein
MGKNPLGVNKGDYFPLSWKAKNSVRARINLYAARDLLGSGNLKSERAALYEQRFARGS